MIFVHFFFSGPKVPLLGMMKIVIWTNQNMLNTMVMFVFPVLEYKYLFWANLVKKIEMVCLR